MFRPVQGYEEDLVFREQDVLNQIQTCEEFKEFGAQLPGLYTQLSQIRETLREIRLEEKKESAPLVEPKVREKIYYNPTHRDIQPQPIYEFNEAQKKLMLEYLEQGDDLDCNTTRTLIKTTMIDEMGLEEVNFSPASVISEGKINCRYEWLKEEYFARAMSFVDKDQPKPKPHEIFKNSPNLQLPCTIDDVIPCHPLYKALHFLLERATNWANENDQEPARPILKKPMHKRHYIFLTEKVVDDLEKLYRRLPASHQLIFNCIMRDETDQIMDKAVQLPSGDVCDQSTAEELLVLISPGVYEGKCLKAPAITYKVVRDEQSKEVYSEMKPATYYSHAVDALKKIAAEVERMVTGPNYKALNDADLSDERDRMIIKLSKFLDKINQPVTLTNNQKCNANVLAIQKAQQKVIQTAINSLRQVESKQFDEDVAYQSLIPGQTYKTVKLNSDTFNDGSTVLSKFFRSAASYLVDTSEQWGYMMPTLIDAVRDLLKRCEADLNLTKAEKQRDCCYFTLS